MRSIHSVEKYAYSVFELAKDEKQLDIYKEQAQVIMEAYELAPKFFTQVYLGKLEANAVAAKFKETFEYQIQHHLAALVSLLVNRGKIHLLNPVLEKTILLINQEKGIHSVVVTSAFELSDQQKEALLVSLKKRFKNEVEATYIIDQSMIGGLSINYESKVLDGSLRTRLDNILDKHNKQSKGA